MPPRLIDRATEIEQLRRLAAAPPALVILSGRRRVGKSFLLRAALDGERVIGFQAEQEPLALQLATFARECARILPGSPPLAFASWDDAFSFLDAQAQQAPLVCVLDEFQYLAQMAPALPSQVQKWWDRWDHNGIPVLLVLSGSALSFMAGLLKGSEGTHGRAGFRPVLQPLCLQDAAEFAPAGSTPIELIERYAVLGGTPQYQRWAGERPLGEVIRDVILPTGAPLHREPEHLIREEDDIRAPGPYFGVMRGIAEGRTTATELGGRLALERQLVDVYLGRLAELGYIDKVVPVAPAGKGSSRGYWNISDPFFRFWFTFVFPNSSRLARGRVSEVAREIELQLPSFVGHVFEDVCRDWIGRRSPLGASADDVGCWWSRKSDVEIDVVTVDGKGYTLLGSCKWWNRPAGENVLDDLLAGRAAIGPTANQAELAVFSKLGCNAALTERAARSGVYLLVPGDLFEHS